MTNPEWNSLLVVQFPMHRGWHGGCACGSFWAARGDDIHDGLIVYPGAAALPFEKVIFEDDFK